MGIMPHTDVDRALQLALSLDIPFCPQLPHISFYEDMYVQTSQNFPGIVVDTEAGKISFSKSRFDEELPAYSSRMADAATFYLSDRYSTVYRRFLALELSRFPAMRGQVTGPVSFGFRVTDEDSRPLIYDDGLRGLLFDFIQRKANAQYRQLLAKNPNAFVWLDEPGLGWVFSGLSGFNDIQARDEYRSFLQGLEGPRAMHLCANVNLPYLLEIGVDLLSFDAYQMDIMPRGYAGSVAGFIQGGGIICWGIVPTDPERLAQETPETLADRISGYWRVVSETTGLDARDIAAHSMLAPARCCLKNVGKVGAQDDPRCKTAVSLSAEEQLVETAFGHLRTMSGLLRHEFGLPHDSFERL